MAEKKKFELVFKERIAEIDRLAKEHGVSISAICRSAKIARGTPELWKEKVPRTIEIVDQMEAALEKEIRKKEKEREKNK